MLKLERRIWTPVLKEKETSPLRQGKKVDVHSPVSTALFILK